MSSISIKADQGSLGALIVTATITLPDGTIQNNAFVVTVVAPEILTGGGGGGGGYGAPVIHGIGSNGEVSPNNNTAIAQ
jgi:hypothetical protein